MKDNNPQSQPKKRSGKQGKKPEKAWYLVTNHVNLLNMLAAGLIMKPEGYTRSYYKDSLDDFPGFLPLFFDVVPVKAIELSTSEAEFLSPCLLEIKLSELKGQVIALSRSGSWRNLSFPDELDGTVTTVFVPASLPVSWIEQIIFKTKDDKEKFEKLAKNSSNISYDSFMGVEKVQKYQSNHPGIVWPPQKQADWPESKNCGVISTRAIAAGGMMAMLYRLSRKGDSIAAACRMAFEGGFEDTVSPSTDTFMQSFSTWLKTGQEPFEGDMAGRLFWKIVNQVLEHKAYKDGNAKDSVLTLLKTELQIIDASRKDHLARLIDDLTSLSTLSDKMVSDLFKIHQGYFSRSLILFFLHDTCSDLLGHLHTEMNEQDIIAASILFGSRDGWVNLPSDFREFNGMEAAVTHRMADLSHHSSKTGIGLGSPPPRPIPLREFFTKGPRNWSAAQREVAVKLAKKNHWPCVHTKISLGKGDYSLVVDGASAHILVPGEVKAVTTDVDWKVFMAKLSETDIPPDVEMSIKMATKVQRS